MFAPLALGIVLAFAGLLLGGRSAPPCRLIPRSRLAALYQDRSLYRFSAAAKSHRLSSVRSLSRDRATRSEDHGYSANRAQLHAEQRRAQGQRDRARDQVHWLDPRLCHVRAGVALHGAAVFGSLAIIFNAMSFLVRDRACGQETLIVRSWDEYRRTDRPALARGALTFGVKVAACRLLMARRSSLVWPGAAGSCRRSAGAGGLRVPVRRSPSCNFCGQFSRVAAGVIIGEIPRELMWRLIVVLTILGASGAADASSTTTDFFVSVAAAHLALAIVLQMWLVARASCRARSNGRTGVGIDRRLDPPIVQHVALGS